MGLGLLTRALFVSCQPLPDVLQQARTLGVNQEVITTLLHVHLAVRWSAYRVSFPTVRVQPDAQDDARLRVVVEVEGFAMLSQLEDACRSVGFEGASFRSDDSGREGYGNLIFTLPEATVMALRHAA